MRLQVYNSFRTAIEPNPHGGGKPPLLNSQQIEILEQLVQEDNAPTLQELSDHLAEKTDVKASLSTICRVLQRLELTRKKRLYTLMKPNLNECKT